MFLTLSTIKILNWMHFCSFRIFVHCRLFSSIPGSTRKTAVKVKVWVTQSCLTLCNPMVWGLPGSSVHGIFQARILEWVAISSAVDPPNPEIELQSPTLQADALPFLPPGKPSIGQERNLQVLSKVSWGRMEYKVLPCWEELMQTLQIFRRYFC